MARQIPLNGLIDIERIDAGIITWNPNDQIGVRDFRGLEIPRHYIIFWYIRSRHFARYTVSDEEQLSHRDGYHNIMYSRGSLDPLHNVLEHRLARKRQQDFPWQAR